MKPTTMKRSSLSLRKAFFWALASFTVAGGAGLGANRACGQQSAMDPARFEKSVVVDGLTQPMEMAIAPDGTIYLIELAGKIKAIEPKSRQVQTIG